MNISTCADFGRRAAAAAQNSTVAWAAAAAASALIASWASRASMSCFLLTCSGREEADGREARSGEGEPLVGVTEGRGIGLT